MRRHPARPRTSRRLRDPARQGAERLAKIRALVCPVGAPGDFAPERPLVVRIDDEQPTADPTYRILTRDRLMAARERSTGDAVRVVVAHQRRCGSYSPTSPEPSSADHRGLRGYDAPGVQSSQAYCLTGVPRVGSDLGQRDELGGVGDDRHPLAEMPPCRSRPAPRSWSQLSPRSLARRPERPGPRAASD
jgi:hypothetical protein